MDGKGGRQNGLARDRDREIESTLVDGWEFGRSAAHDWVVSHTLQKAALEAGKGRRPNFTLEQSERRKDSHAKRRCEMRGLDFVPKELR